MQIWEYHIDPDVARARVEAQQWIPFGVVGLRDAGEGFEEIAVDGTLFLDLTRATETDAPVIYMQSARGSDQLPVSFAELIATAVYPHIDS